ncbi:hypothetical protein MKEN_00302400 [Mycena kentingensis (nom. inval.)]|nr:hypothetical protein MKEN_00302400 [Mycena kentingensis (nom. inval.)]
MHHCLRIPEIVHLVVAEAYGSKEGLKTLAALARTCRFFEGPALDEMWKRPGHKTLLYIVRTFPGGLFTIDNDFNITLIAGVREDHWERPLRYCRRIREFTFSDEAQIDILRNLCLWLPEDVLFPNLRQLHFRAAGSLGVSETNLLRQLIPPGLCSLRVTKPSRQILSILPFITRRIRSLHSLNFDPYSLLFDSASPSATPALSMFICCFAALQTLFLPVVDRKILRHIAKLPNLCELELWRFEPDLSEGDLQSLSSYPRFPSLRRLEIGTITDRITASMASVLAAPSLEDLSISNTTDSFGISNFYGEVTKPGRDFSSLRIFKHHSTFGPCTISGKMLFQLSRYSNLRTLDIVMASVIGVDDAAIESASQSWPALTSFCLKQLHEDPPRTTLAALVSLARNCTNLHSISLAFDTTIVPPMPQASTGRWIQNHQLAKVDVGYSRVDTTFPIASFLSALFPRLARISASWEDDEEDPEGTEMSAKWKKVEDLVPQLAAVRAEGANLQ